MPRERDPSRERAFELWRDSSGKLDLVEIATQLGISAGTVRGWKSKDRWEERIGMERSNTRSVPKRSERSKQHRTVSLIAAGLTEKQRLFVFEYLRDFNATRAAMAVGYSKKTAYSIGWELLRNPEVQAEIKRQKEIRAEELGLDVKRIIAELMKIAFTDISDILEFGQRDEPVFDENGALIINPHTGMPYTQKRNFVVLKNADEVDSTVIGEVKQTKEGVSVKLHDKMRALEKLERYIPYLTEEEKLRIEKLKVDIKSAELKVF
jgi:phage terminase small subunit